VLFRNNRATTLVQTYRVIEGTDVVLFFIDPILFWTHDCYMQQNSNTYCLGTSVTSVTPRAMLELAYLCDP